MEIPFLEGSSPPCVPARIRQRLTETKTSYSTVEEIEAKLRNADLRRQKFYENLSSKARPKHRAPQAADEHNLAQRLEAKLQAAEHKRMQILKANSQRRAILSQKASHSLLRTNALHSKYKEHVDASKKKAHARLQVRSVAKSVSQQQQIERQKLSESLEDKRQRAKRPRAKYLMEKVNLHNNTQKQAEHLSRSLLRCWRKFLKQRTTIDLVKNFHLLNIRSSHEKSMPFEHFAYLIETPSTLQTIKALLDRLETRYRVTSGTNMNDINHLLKRVVLPNNRYVEKAESLKTSRKTSVKLSRYQPRVVLSAYMMLGYPDVVFSGLGDRETALANSAKKFIQEFELMTDIILNGSPHCTFRSQLEAYDVAWCSYLNSFVIWKVKDVESLEKDLVRAACQMEISMMRKYKPTPKANDIALANDLKSFQKQMQVTEHQKLLGEKIMHLSGEAGMVRLRNALSDTRRQYSKSKEKSSSVEPPVTHIVPSNGPVGRSHSVDQLPFPDHDSMSPLEDSGSSVASGSGLVNISDGEMLGMENVFIVNEFLHGRRYEDNESLNITDENQKVRETMEKAFWDGISDSIQQEKYDHVVVLMKEVRDELCEMSPKTRKQEILEVIDLDILSQLLSSRCLDMKYLGTIMEFALVSLQKLSAIANENQLKQSHQKFISELAQLCQAGDGSNHSHAIALVKGLRFVLEEIQVLKQNISKAHIKILEPLLKGPAGLEYLGKAFTKVYGPPSDALIRLPLTMQWLSSVVPVKDQEWNEHMKALSDLQQHLSSERTALPSTALRTGGRFPSRLQTSPATSLSDISGVDNGYTECKGEKSDLLVRLGLLKLVNNVNGVTQELPETLKLNFHRLRSVQDQLQKITVIATSILVLRQTLVMEQMISNHEEMENTIVTCSTQLSHILDTVIDAGLEELVAVLSKAVEAFDTANDSTKTQSRRLVMARMLRKSVQAGDPIFVKVSRAMYLATRGVVLGGSGPKGREMAEKALIQVGAAVLTDKLVDFTEVLGVIAKVSTNVHGLWYARLIENM